jgi:hypothetical protein
MREDEFTTGIAIAVISKKLGQHRSTPLARIVQLVPDESKEL